VVNKFGTREMQSLIDRARMEQARIAAGDESGSVKELTDLLADVGDTLDAAHRYFLSVEAALV
jgi:hypothetical protein